jgi:hypothetical protein
MSVVINVKSIDDEEDKESCCDKCFHFWGEEHPFCLMWLFILFIAAMSIGISEYGKSQ